MLEQRYGLTFFLNSARENSRNIRLVYVRITVDGISKECLNNNKLTTALDLIDFVNGKYKRHNSVLEYSKPGQSNL